MPTPTLSLSPADLAHAYLMAKSEGDDATATKIRALLLGEEQTFADAAGHEHKSKGPGGGQFVKKGEGGGDSDKGDSATDTKAFKDWFGDSKVVDDSGKPLTVYHGTPENFDRFDPEAGKELGGFGQGGVFFTKDKEVAESYAPHQPLIEKKLIREHEKAVQERDEFLDNIREKVGDSSVPERSNNRLRWMNGLLDAGKITRDEYDKSSELDDKVYDLSHNIANHPDTREPKVLSCYLSMKNPKVVNANGMNWDIIVPRVLEDLDRDKYDGVIFKNIKDNGGNEERVTDTYFIFKPEQAKSTDNSGEFDPKDPRMKFADFDESAHPRNHGKFAKKGEGSGGGDSSPEHHEAAHALVSELAASEPALKDGVLTKAKALAVTGLAKGMLFLAKHHDLLARGSAVLDGVLDTPDDLKKFGYEPTVSGVGHGTADPTREHLGIGSHLAIKLASATIVHALKMAKKLAGKQHAEGDFSVEDVAQMLAGLFGAVNEEYGLVGGVDVGRIREGLKSLKGA